MKDDTEYAGLWSGTLGEIYRYAAPPEGTLYAGLLDKNQSLRNLTVYYLKAAQHVMLDPVSVLLMRLYQDAGKAGAKEHTFEICASPTFRISVEAQGLIDYFEATQGGAHKVHFTRLDFKTVRPAAQKTLAYKLKTAESIDIPKSKVKIPEYHYASFDLTADTDANKKVHRLYMAAAFSLIKGRVGLIGAAYGYNIGAILVSGEGRILSYGLNIAYRGYFLHAELMAIYDYFRRTGNVTLPSSCRIYTTLKPCKMCAAYIVGRLPERPASFKVFHGHYDRGGPAQNTELDRLNQSQNAQISVRIGADGSKPLRSFVATEYDADDKAAHRHWEDAAAELSRTVQYNHQTQQGIVMQLVSKAPAEFPKITNSLLRKGHKYGGGSGGNENVRKALVHILEFLEAAGVLATGTLTSLLGDEPFWTEQVWREIDALLAGGSESKKRDRDADVAGPSAPNNDPSAASSTTALDPDELELGRQLKRWAPAPPPPGPSNAWPGVPGQQGEFQ
jgi:pyrimidine deaminase RibD-like protein